MKRRQSTKTVTFGEHIRRSIFSGDAKQVPAKPFADGGIAVWFGADACGCASVCVLHDEPARGLAGAAEQHGGPQPQGLAAASTRTKRFEFPGACDARHAGRARAVSADRLESTVRTHPRGFGRSAAN